MASPETRKIFIQKISDRLHIRLADNARVIGIGEESVVVASNSSVFKCYCSNPYDRTGFRFSARERAALKAFGGYAGQHVSIPKFIRHERFVPFEWNGRHFTCVTEQSRMAGKPIPHEELADGVALGKAVGEFHILLSTRPHFARAVANQVERSMRWCVPHGDKQEGLPPDVYRRLKKDVQALVQGSVACSTHGDLHHDNILNHEQKFAFLDHSMTGPSYAEHDMAQFSPYPETLRGMFKGYAQMTGVRLSKKNAVVLYALNLGQISVQHQRLGNQKLASAYVDELRALMS